MSKINYVEKTMNQMAQAILLLNNNIKLLNDRLDRLEKHEQSSTQPKHQNNEPRNPNTAGGEENALRIKRSDE